MIKVDAPLSEGLFAALPGEDAVMGHDIAVNCDRWLDALTKREVRSGESAQNVSGVLTTNRGVGRVPWFGPALSPPSSSSSPEVRKRVPLPHPRWGGCQQPI